MLLDGGHVEGTYVNEVAGDGGGRGHYWADEMRAAVFTLTAFEIAIRSAGAAFVRRKNVGVHGETHAAASVAPFKASVAKNFVEAFLFGLRFDDTRARYDEGLFDVSREMLARYDIRCGATVSNAGIA